MQGFFYCYVSINKLPLEEVLLDFYSNFDISEGE